MFAFLDPLRGVSFLSVSLRLVLAVVCGGIVGAERSYKRRPVGFRTHILTCLGAAMTSTTSVYLVFYMQYHTDIARLGAQVIAGVGFIGAGSIMVTHGNRVKGLTTAAGFWTSAIAGLALGFGFYEAALTATALIMVVEKLLIKVEYKIVGWNPEATIYVESLHKDSVEEILALLREKKILVRDMELSQIPGDGKQSFCTILNLRLARGSEFSELVDSLEQIDGIVAVEEL